MKKFAKIIDKKNKICEVGLGIDIDFYISIGMTEQDVEQAWDGMWYLSGYAPQKPQEIIDIEEITVLKRKLSDSDYAVIKIAEGAATTEEYAGLIEQRATWRACINELEKGLAE